MTDFDKIIWTSSLTIVAGIFVFVIGQLLVKFLIEPLQEYAKLRGEIAESIIFYSNVGAAVAPYYIRQLQAAHSLEEPVKKLTIERYEQLIKEQWKKSDDAAIKLRQQASQLLARTYAIPLYSLWSFVGVVPSISAVNEATRNIIGMSNATHEERGHTGSITTIAKLLKINTVLHHLGAK